MRNSPLSESPLEEVTDALYNKGVKFLMTHDMRLTLPEMMFNGAILKVSPRALTKSGALVHIDLEPNENDNGDGRLFFHKISEYLWEYHGFIKLGPNSRKNMSMSLFFLPNIMIENSNNVFRFLYQSLVLVSAISSSGSPIQW